ncbi:2-C-methyl-D-erythritol 4-phosphate cytidylyltransferase [Gilliamella apicola]|uniref:2-C-methyl-D-erythritol 4-phosphate cytidylyltransferase n=1 Tax=Gilliamella apicola TaxID=1196095 RepID=A0A2V4E751_9GAMM|nr:2-C-methyl-D-erythritol 4-phosphate cytidylyltransferase [Gilliamella apicola]
MVAIVPAAGIGCRMESQLPKQYLKIGAMTILEHTLQKLLTHSKISEVVVVINKEDKLFSTLDVASKVKVTYGGKTRADSVLAGLNLVSENKWALVHDAARPCVTHQDITKLINRVLQEDKGGILAMPLSDTIKQADTNNPDIINHSIDRTYLWGAATPQLFKAGELKACLNRALNNHIAITDEASAIEYCGGHPLLVECRRDNIKITCPEDLNLATYYLTNQI